MCSCHESNKMVSSEGLYHGRSLQANNEKQLKKRFKGYKKTLLPKYKSMKNN